jgi:putative FmdB family regulatory protein
MPIYEYECEACGERFERHQRMTDPPIEDCPACREREVRKLISASSFQLKGSGWYVTDYSRKGQSNKPEPTAAD